jgi:NitT/TauT family transport system substrate-binding protein
MALERRSFIGSAAAALAAGALGGTAVAQAAPKILVGYWPISAALPFFVADRNGYWKDAGLDVTLVKFADQVKVTEALLAGRIDATATGTGSTQLATAEIASPNFFKILGANLSSDKSILDSFIVAKGAPYKRIADLKGKKVACGVGPQAVVEATIILQKAGAGDVVPQELSPAQHIAAVAAGQVDAAYTYEPNGTIGHIQGLTDFLEVGVRSRYLLGNPSAPWYGGAAVITTDFMKKDPASTKKFVTGMKRGFDATRKDLNAARTAYTAYTSYDPKLVEAILPISYTLYDEFKPSDMQYFQDNFDLFFAKNILTRKLSVAALLYKG